MTNQIPFVQRMSHLVPRCGYTTALASKFGTGQDYVTSTDNTQSY